MNDLDKLIETLERLTKALEAHNNLHPLNSGYFPGTPAEPQCTCNWGITSVCPVHHRYCRTSNVIINE